MIVYFRMNNFLSFQDEITLNMKASSYKEHPTHLIVFDKINLIKTMAIYGANASGKSNLIQGLSFFCFFIKQKIAITLQDNNIFEPAHLIIEPFKFSNNKTQDTEMDISFISQESIFEYSITICGDKIHKEQLTIDHSLVFQRDNTDIKLET